MKGEGGRGKKGGGGGRGTARGRSRRTFARRLLPSKHKASRRPLPSILMTWAYSWPSSLNVNSRRWSSFSFVPLLRFLPPCASSVSSATQIPGKYPPWRGRGGTGFSCAPFPCSWACWLLGVVLRRRRDGGRGEGRSSNRVTALATSLQGRVCSCVATHGGRGLGDLLADDSYCLVLLSIRTSYSVRRKLFALCIRSGPAATLVLTLYSARWRRAAVPLF